MLPLAVAAAVAAVAVVVVVVVAASVVPCSCELLYVMHKIIYTILAPQ